ncbi:hypothetical protein SCG7109_BO_00010, partial [Chlamydiales bacterium SCGC AG-110-M15]
QKVQAAEMVLDHLRKIKSEENSSDADARSVEDPSEPINIAIQTASDLLNKYESVASSSTHLDSSSDYEAPTSTNYSYQETSTLQRFFSGDFKSPFERVTDLLRNLMKK